MALSIKAIRTARLITVVFICAFLWFPIKVANATESENDELTQELLYLREEAEALLYITTASKRLSHAERLIRKG